MTARILKRFNREQLTLGAAGGLAGLLLLTGLGGGEPAGATFRLPSAERAYASAPSTAPEYVHEKFSVYWDGRDIFMPVAVDKLPVPDLTPPMPRLEPLALPPLGPGPAFEALNRLTHGTISVGAADLPSDAELAELVNLAEPEPAAPADRRAEKMREWDVIHRTGNLAPLEGRIVHEAPGYVDFQGKDKARMRIPWSQVSFDKKTGEPWIERGWTYEEEYRHRSGRLKGGDASGRIALAEWSREYGMTTEAAQEYRAAVEILKARGDFKKEFFDIVGAAGDLMCETGDFDGAVALYAAVMQWTPFERAEMAVRTGDAMRALGLNEAALDAYGQALEASPRTTRARASQARLLYQSGRDAEAVAAVGELFAKYADTVKPAERVEATVVRGLALLRGGDTSGADEAFAEALRIDAKNAEALNGKGVVCALGGRPKEAAALFVAALRANQYLIEAWTNLGVWALIAGKSSEADGMFAAAVRRDPTSVSALAGQAATLAVKGQPKEALAKVEEALRIDPEYFYGRYVRGWLRLQEGDHEGALPDFLGALQAEYHFLPSHAGAAMAFLRAASHSEAQALLETVRDFDGSRAATHITLGCVLAARGRGPEAERVFQRALELSSGPDPLLAYGRGYVAYKHGDADVKQRLVAARSLFQHGAGMQTTNPGDGEWVARCAEAVGRITDWQDTDVLFDDRFERPDGAVVGGGWIQADKTHGVAIDLAGGRVRFSGKQTKEMGLTRLEREDVRKQDFLSFEATLRPESGRCEYGVSVYFARQSETQWMGLHVGVDLGGRLRYRQAGSVEFATSRLDYSGTEPAKFERPDRNEITLRVQRRAEQRGAYAFDISVWSASKSEWIPAVKGLPVHALGSHPSYRVGIWARAPLGQSYTLWADNARVLLKRAGP